jgi:hypothetical protein
VAGVLNSACVSANGGRSPPVEQIDRPVRGWKRLTWGYAAMVQVRADSHERGLLAARVISAWIFASVTTAHITWVKA